eukprot:365638-Chlamydomonas_euryale.AAC.1
MHCCTVPGTCQGQRNHAAQIFFFRLRHQVGRVWSGLDEQAGPSNEQKRQLEGSCKPAEMLRISPHAKASQGMHALLVALHATRLTKNAMRAIAPHAPHRAMSCRFSLPCGHQGTHPSWPPTQPSRGQNYVHPHARSLADTPAGEAC